MTNKHFWKATVVRLIRTFLTTILGVWTAGTLITDIDWRAALMAAFSATVYIFILCIIAGLPEVDDVDDDILEEDDEDDEEYYYEEEEFEDDDERP